MKQAYYNRRWNQCKVATRKGELYYLKCGEVVTRLNIREACPPCGWCGMHIIQNSYQALDGSSVCAKCYREAPDFRHFGGPIWFSWDGAIYVKDMDDQHLIATIGMLVKNAELAADQCGGKKEEYLSNMFPELVKELRNRKAPEEQIKVNVLLVNLYMVLLTMIGFKGGRSSQE